MQTKIGLELHMVVFWLGCVLAAGIISYGLARLVRMNAHKLNLVQSPNERSSHVIPTPSGGGVGIAVAGSALGLVVSLYGGAAAWSVLAVTSAIAVLGLLDDMHNLSSRLRFAVQMVLTVMILVFAGDLPPLHLLAVTVPAPLVYAVLFVFGVWWINLFNFMDGIDGLAGGESIILLAGGCILALVTFPAAGEDAMWWWGMIVATAAAGFLVQNWPPAKVFMGDAGSNYLALLIFGFALYTITAGWLSYASWIVLAALFVSDASITLITRMAGGQRWADAHRQHGYQILSRKWQSHKRVTMLYLGITMLWLVPLAYLTLTVPDLAWLTIIAAYGPIIVGIVLTGAGKPDRPA